VRILAIGGNGFMGIHVVDCLERMGHEVLVFRRKPGARTLAGDRNRLPDYRRELERFGPDVALDMILSNGRQAAQLMSVMRGVAGRVVAVSSIDVYRAAGRLHRTEPGPPDPVPLTEDSPLREKPPYPPEAVRSLQGIFSWLDAEYDKVPVERAVLGDPELPGTVLRLPMVYGPGDPLHRLFPILKRVDDGRPVIVVGEEAAGWRAARGYVENVAAAIALATVSERAAGRVYNVAEEEAFTELEWTRRVAAAAGWDGEVAVVGADATPAHLKFAGDARQHWSASSGRIRGELGYCEEVSLVEALRRTIAWERANPPAQVDPAQFDYAAEDAAARPAGGTAH
jgi:nucleoside-diphosphate-sugar epimerase